MKLKTKPSKSREPEKKKKNPMMREPEKKEKSPTASDEDGDDWLIQGRDEIDKATKHQEVLAKRNRRPPEVWIPAEESRVLRFLTSEPVAIFRYSLRGPGGKWISVTQPSRGETDLMQRAGLLASLRFIYPVIDVDGYEDKKTKKKLTKLPRYFVASGKAEKSLEKIREKKGSLTKYPIEVCRSGESTATTYSFLLDDPSPMPPEFTAAKKVLEKELRDYYKPPTEEEQRAILSGVSLSGDDDEDSSKSRSSSKRRESY